MIRPDEHTTDQTPDLPLVKLWGGRFDEPPMRL